MKTKFIISFLICLTLIPVVLWAQNDSIDKKQAAIFELIGKKKFNDAEAFIHSELNKLKAQKQSPYVENGILYLYAESEDESLILLLSVAELATRTEEERKKISWYHELETEFQWNSVQIQLAYVPFLYYSLAYIAIEKNDFPNAEKLLDQALELYPHYLTALAEKTHVYLMLRDFEKAKSLAWQTINDVYPYPEKRKAILYRKLGYIAIEEGELDKAEEYYKKSLELEPDNKGALGELDYIESLRKQKSNSIP